MARLWSCGFELNSVTAGVEIDSVTQTGGAPTISTTTIRSDTYSLRCNPTTGTSYVVRQFAAASANNDIYIRFYYRWHTSPGASNTIMLLRDTGAAATVLSVQHVTSTNTLRILDDFNTQIGSPSSALTVDTWYRIEVKYVNSTGATSIRIDGTDFVTSGSNTSGYSANQIRLGSQGSAVSTDIFFDDVAVNDSTGSFQTTYPGAGQIVALRPNAAGDNNAFTVQVGGTAGAANNYTRVSEVTPDDVTTYNGDALSGDIDDFNITDTPSSIGSSDTINVVHVGIRYQAVVAAAEAAFKARIKKASAGTVTSSTAVTPNSTTWKTNTNAIPNTFPLTLYQDPDSSNWTKATLDTTQIGYTISATNTNAANISAVWLLVDSTPAVAVTFIAQPNKLVQQAINRSRTY